MINPAGIGFLAPVAHILAVVETRDLVLIFKLVEEVASLFDVFLFLDTESPDDLFETESSSCIFAQQRFDSGPQMGESFAVLFMLSR